jgi:hypothetical protein
VRAAELGSTLEQVSNYHQRAMDMPQLRSMYEAVEPVPRSTKKKTAEVLMTSFDNRAEELYQIAREAKVPVSEIASSIYNGSGKLPPDIELFNNMKYSIAGWEDHVANKTEHADLLTAVTVKELKADFADAYKKGQESFNHLEKQPRVRGLARFGSPDSRELSELKGRLSALAKDVRHLRAGKSQSSNPYSSSTHRSTVATVGGSLRQYRQSNQSLASGEELLGVSQHPWATQSKTSLYAAAQSTESLAAQWARALRSGSQTSLRGVPKQGTSLGF